VNAPPPPSDHRPREAFTRLVYGIQPAREAIAVHGAKLVRVLVEQRPREAEQLEAIARFAHDRGAPVQRVDRGMLDRLAHGERHQGVIVEAPPFAILDPSTLMMVPEGAPPPLLIALDELTDPQNFGAIVRSAVALGATGVAWPEDRSAPLSGAMVRASAGAVEHARLCRVRSLPRLLSDFAEGGLSVIGLDAATPTHLHALPLTGPVALVVGAEGKGLRKATKHACTALARLTMPGPIGSLNASVAAALALYEVVRQREGVSSPPR
jgi:23S rRNA (guanosine2251-2'-O)-methyltransferase